MLNILQILAFQCELALNSKRVNIDQFYVFYGCKLFVTVQ